MVCDCLNCCETVTELMVDGRTDGVDRVAR